MRLLAAIAVILLSTVLPAAAQPDAAAERVVVTRQDLLEMTEAGLPVSLIVKTVRNADEVPALQPLDLISLQRLGVAAEVLEAVVEHGGRSAEDESAVRARPASPADAPRRIRVSAKLDSKRRWFKNPFSSDEGVLTIYWAVALDGPGAAVADCPREPICWCANSIGEKTCSQPDDKLWSRYLACHRAVEMTLGEGVEIFDLQLTGSAPSEIRVIPFVMIRERDDSLRLEAWSSIDHGPSYLAVEPGEATSFDAEWNLALDDAGSRTDFRVVSSRFDAEGDSQPGRRVTRIRPASGAELLPSGLCRP